MLHVRIFVVALVMGLGALPVFGNDGVFYAMGNTLVPVKETRISMDKEVLSLKRNGEWVEVSVYFEFMNPDAARELTVGFVTPPAMGDVDEETAAHPQIRDFTVSVNGKALTYKMHRMEESGFKLMDKQVNGEDFVYHFDMTFQPGLNKVKHTYAFRGGGSVDASFDCAYRLTTGTQWAGGKIKDFSLSIDMGEDAYFSVPSTFWKSGKAIDWKITGKGKVATHDHEIFSFTERMIRTLEGTVGFKAKDFAPEMDLSVSVYHLHNEVHMWDPRPNAPETIFQKHPFLIMGHPEEGEMDNLSKAELRILRNYFFARHGYQFKSADLSALFGRFSWYMPDPAVKADVGVLTEQEKKVYNMVVAAEKKKK